ncbi:SAM-dependent methyltransferase [Ethanoligenens harbinense]|nr:SAM-dependent methyltransferase [Ethanoligenens harbinense YUAN-3]AYF41165.1 SAM-dependent methyltransferase [Ethanoligenens harbinense]QCN91997.1 SAM-dependent methyltransferase [Ethanoligenens harbinense]
MPSGVPDGICFLENKPEWPVWRHGGVPGCAVTEGFMSALPPLSARLRLAASFVRSGVTVADIGTDHAYLPVWLVCSGHNPSALACDVRSGPLARAAQTVAQYGVQEQVVLRQTDGLAGVQAQDIVIAGMGGELIAAILSRSEWVRRPDVRLILQPMTAQETLRAWLCREGFVIDREDAAMEGDKHYLVMCVRYGGVPFEPDAFFCFAGRLPETGSRAGRDYLCWQARRLRKKADGLARSAARAAQAETWSALAARLERAAEQI